MDNILPKREPLIVFPLEGRKPSTDWKGYDQEEEPAFLQLLNQLAADADAGRLETGKAEICWSPDPMIRLQHYVNHGFPLWSRLDSFVTVRDAATAVLGPLTGWIANCSGNGNKSNLDSLQWHVNKILAPAEYRGTFEYLEDAIWKADKELARKGQVVTPVLNTLTALEGNIRGRDTAWFKYAATRRRAGLPYVIRLGSPLVEGSKAHNQQKRQEYTNKNGWRSPDVVFENGFSAWYTYFHKFPTLLTREHRSPGLPYEVRRMACDKFGYDLEAFAEDADQFIRQRYLIGNGKVTADHRQDNDHVVRVHAVRKFGVTQAHVDDQFLRIRIRHRLRYGFSPEEMSDPLKNINKGLLGLYVRKHGVPAPSWVTSCSDFPEYVRSRIRRFLDSSGYGKGVRKASRVCDYLLGGDSSQRVEAYFSIFGGYSTASTHVSPISGMQYFLAAAVETIAEHPEVFQEYELFLGGVEASLNKTVFMKALSFIQQQAPEILAAKERRMLGLGTKEVPDVTD